MDWKFPEIEVSDPVEFTIRPGQADTSLAWVVRKRARSCDVLTFVGGRPVLREECIHADDPDLADRMDMFNDGTIGGVFRIAKYIQDNRNLSRRIQRCEEFCSDLSKRLEDLGKLMKNGR